MQKTNDVLAAERLEAEAKEYEQRAAKTEQVLDGYSEDSRPDAMSYIEELRTTARCALVLAKVHRARNK